MHGDYKYTLMNIKISRQVILYAAIKLSRTARRLYGYSIDTSWFRLQLYNTLIIFQPYVYDQQHHILLSFKDTLCLKHIFYARDSKWQKQRYKRRQRNVRFRKACFPVFIIQDSRQNIYLKCNIVRYKGIQAVDRTIACSFFVEIFGTHTINLKYEYSFIINGHDIRLRMYNPELFNERMDMIPADQDTVLHWLHQTTIDTKYKSSIYTLGCSAGDGDGFVYYSRFRNFRKLMRSFAHLADIFFCCMLTRHSMKD